MRPTLTIRSRFLAGILLVAVPALVALAWLEDRYVSRLMTTVGTSQFSNDVLDAADDIASVTDAARHELHTLADLLEDSAGTSGEHARVQAAFASTIDEDGVFRELARLDSAGRVREHEVADGATPVLGARCDLSRFPLAALDDETDGVAARAVTVAPAGQFGSQSVLLLTPFAPASSDGGYLAAIVDPSRLLRSFATAALSGGRILFLVDARGRPIAYADDAHPGEVGTTIPAHLPYPAALQALIQQGGTGLIDRGFPSIVASTCLDADSSGALPPWIVGESMPRAALLSNIRDMRRHTLIVVAITALVAMLLAMLLARQITRPIEALRRGAERIAGGDLDHRLHIATGDEVGELARSFAAMTASLRSTLDELRHERQLLEHRVDERTAQLRRQGEELERAYDQLQSVDQVKSTFIANVSHELRTPLTMLRGAIELLAMHPPDGPEAELLLIAVDGVERLHAIVQKILDYSDVDAGPASWPMSPVDAVALARLVADTHAADAARKQIVLVTSADDGVPPVWACADKLRVALAHLVANAIAYSPEGSTVGVAATHFTDDAGCVWVELAVQDTGPGVAEEDIPRLLQLFEQGGEILTAKPQGVGLGLPVARRIAEYSGGTLRVDSVPGAGSTFAIALPAMTELQRAAA